MRFMIGLFVIIFLSLPNFNSHADTIYSWTDQDGVRKFSNLSPEGDVEDFEVIEEVPLSETADTRDETVEEETVDLVQEPEIENEDIDLRTMEIQIPPQETESEETVNNDIEEQSDLKIEAEKTRLREEINRIDQLAVGKGLSLPRKNTMIQNLQDQLELLDKSPEEYFGAGNSE